MYESNIGLYYAPVSTISRYPMYESNIGLYPMLGYGAPSGLVFRILRN
jgi:hypothetical protein